MRNKHIQRYSEQLGMSVSTAGARLIKDLLFNEVNGRGEVCYRCKLPMTRDNFTMDHKDPWRNKENAAELFFDVKNVAFSHLSCNSAVQIKELKPCGTHAAYSRGCRCVECKAEQSKRRKLRPYDAEERRQRYLKTKLVP